MQGYVTYCFSDWMSASFQRGIMRIRDGERVDLPIRRPLRSDEREGREYYVKPDPDFERGTYSVCHRRLRIALDAGDLLFFRSLWRGKQYLIGYFSVAEKRGPDDDPVIIADLARSRLVHFQLPITLRVARIINPETRFRRGVADNAVLNGRLGRNYKRLPPKAADRLVALCNDL